MRLHSPPPAPSPHPPRRAHPLRGHTLTGAGRRASAELGRVRRRSIHQRRLALQQRVRLLEAPSATCSAGRETFSAIWVGLGGDRESRHARWSRSAPTPTARARGAPSTRAGTSCSRPAPVSLALACRPAIGVRVGDRARPPRDARVRDLSTGARFTVTGAPPPSTLLGGVDHRGALGMRERPHLSAAAAHRLRGFRLLRAPPRAPDRAPGRSPIRRLGGHGAGTAAERRHRRRGTGRHPCRPHANVDPRHTVVDLPSRRGLLGELAGTVDPDRTAERAHAARVGQRSGVSGLRRPRTGGAQMISRGAAAADVAASDCVRRASATSARAGALLPAPGLVPR